MSFKPSQLFFTFCLPLLLGISAQAQYYGDDCSDIDVRENLPKEMKKFFAVPRNQGDMGLCYAFSAADLLSYRLEKPLSAIHAGLIYNQSIGPVGSLLRTMVGINDKGTNEGGDVTMALQEIQSQGALCLEKDFPSSALLGLKASLQDMRANVKDNRPVGDSIFSIITLKSFFPKLDATESYEFLRSHTHQDLDRNLVLLAQKNCQQDLVKVKADLRFSNYVNSNPGNFIYQLNYLLKSNRPVAMHYYPFPFFNEAQLKQFSLFSKVSLSHVAVVVGRKKIAGQCMYMIRNSWGSTCSYYKTGTICDAKQGIFLMSEKDAAGYGAALHYIDN